MKLGLLFASAILAAGNVFGGMTVTEENDMLYGSDDNYTQGLEFRWWGERKTVRDKGRTWTLALRNLIYTPTDITNSQPQPGDRPWAGLTAASYGELEAENGVLTMWDAMLGAVGDWAASDFFQTEWHRITNNRLPRGWDNDIPNEPVANVQLLRSWELVGRQAGNVKWLAVEAGGLADVGTAFDDAAAFCQAQVGLNPPSCRGLGVIGPKDLGGWSAYLFGGGMAKAVLHNVMLGGSLWQDGPSQDMEWLVCDLWWGACVSKDVLGFGLSATFTGSYRTKEFRGQGEDQEWGSLKLGFGRAF